MRFLFLILFLAGCSSGAVVFAPTATPPDLSPVRYEHPGGAFSLVVPRTWSVYEQNTSTLATASFAAPDDPEPTLLVGVVNLGAQLDVESFATLINEYQQQVRPDSGFYTEQDRQAMGDGSWRLTGLRQTAGGAAQQVNTFIERSGSFMGVLDVIVPENPDDQSELQAVINSFRINPDAPLQAAELSALSYATRTSLDILNTSAWTTPTGVFFITGEVANYSGLPVSGVPVRAVLFTADGLGVAEAVDTVMGYTILPGGFAPFSLRFGQGQPPSTSTYMLAVGGAEWQPDDPLAVYGSDQLTWTDESTLADQGQLIITGMVTNTGTEVVRDLRVMATVFDAARRVIAAGYTDIQPVELAPGESAEFRLVVPEMGGTPVNYIVSIQGLP